MILSPHNKLRELRVLKVVKKHTHPHIQHTFIGTSYAFCLESHTHLHR